MKTFAIGDVHGCLTALKTLLEFIKIERTDRFIMLGDYVDRGPDSAQVIQFLIEETVVRNLTCLKGNHEIMMERSRNDLQESRQWALCGGDTTWDSYSRGYEGEGLAAVPETHWNFIGQCLPYFETEKHIFVHAAVEGDIELCDQPDYMLYWESFNSIAPHQSGKKVICGHTSQKSGTPVNAGHAVCIDTWVYGSGWLTCLNVDTGEYFQANQQGETRSDWLEE